MYQNPKATKGQGLMPQQSNRIAVRKNGRNARCIQHAAHHFCLWPTVGDMSNDNSAVTSRVHTRRSTIIFLISAMALAGLSPFGQAFAQFMMVWQR
jgi:hypothetical protein